MAQYTLCIAWLSGKSAASVDDPQVCWGIYSGFTPASVLRYTPLSEVRENLPSDLNLDSSKVLLIVPGEEVLLTPVQVPSTRARYLERALPFLLEEQLLEPLENYFILHKPIAKTKEFPVAAVNHNSMEYWINKLKEVGFSPDYLFPDTFVMPQEPNKICIYVDKERALFRANDWRVAACDTEQLPFFIKVFVNDLISSEGEEQNTEASDESEQLEDELHNEVILEEDTLIFDEDEPASQSSELEIQILYPKRGMDLDRKISRIVRILNEETDQGLKAQALYLPKSFHIMLFESALKQIKDNSAFQLLQQQYRPERKQTRVVNKKVPVIIGLAAMLLILVGVQLIFQGGYFKDLEAEQMAENKAYFKELFPEERKRITNIRRQMTAMMKKQSGDQSYHFLHYYEIIGNSVSKARGSNKSSIKVRRYSFNQKENETKLDLVVQDFPLLDTLKNELEGQRMDVQISNANKDGNRVKARVIIRPVS